ncbi:metabotropic glycine receptor-like [Corticium candelabrum]|uniref:metabotropic glycine receptor-like n=1 Tax=Corticium candelabrum TaxID=121492 RepID=UPI002E263416|nr:metabotropic glycine receptor-like [Corticium candelabrum]
MSSSSYACFLLLLLKRTSLTYASDHNDVAIRAIHMVYQKRAEGAAGNCTPGALDTVELLYDEKRWINKARTAVFLANLVTSVLSVMDAENSSENQRARFDPVYGPMDDRWLYDIVRNTVETDRDVIGSGICFARYKYKNYQNFCPYASESQDTSLGDPEHVTVKDLSIPNYFYTDEKTEAEWWHGPRKKLKGRLEWGLSHFEFLGQHKVLSTVMQDFPVVTVDDGYWTKPYYDCGGAYRWMITYLAPFLSRVSHGLDIYHYIGVTSIDIDLSHIDINQCDTEPHANSTKEGHKDVLTDQFRGSHRCNSDTTFCRFIPGYGFRRGSYTCMCKPGWYFNPSLKLNDISIEYEGSWGFNGTFLEKEYDKTPGSGTRFHQTSNVFNCLECAPGCEECVDDRPCVFSPQYGLRGGVLTIPTIIIITICIMGAFVIRYRDKHIVKSAGTLCLMVTLFGLFISCGSLYVAIGKPSDISCLFQRWLFHIGMILFTGPLLLIAYQMATPRQNRTAKVPLVNITEKQLLMRLAVVVMLVIVYLAIWTGNDPVVLEETRYGSLKVFVCCNNGFLAVPMYALQSFVLVLGCYFGFKIRMIPAPFHENKRLFVTICNIMIMLFLFVLLDHVLSLLGTNPDHIFLVDCVILSANHSVVLGLVYGTKVYAVVRGKADEAYSRSRGSIVSSTFKSPSAVTGYFEKPTDNANAMDGAEMRSPQEENCQVDLPARIKKDETEDATLPADNVTAELLEQESEGKSCYSEPPSASQTGDSYDHNNEISSFRNTEVSAHGGAGRVRVTLVENDAAHDITWSSMSQLEQRKCSALRRRSSIKVHSMLRSFSQGDLSGDISRRASSFFESGVSVTSDSCPSLRRPSLVTSYNEMVDCSVIKPTVCQYLLLGNLEKREVQGNLDEAALVEDNDENEINTETGYKEERQHTSNVV